MDLGGPQRVPSLSLSPADSSKFATGDHDRAQTLGAVLGRHRRSLSSIATMTSNSGGGGGEAQSAVSRASGQVEIHHNDDQQKAAAIALRLSPSASATGTTNLETDATYQWYRRQIGNYVNLDPVRDLIVRHAIELAIILVILIYLVYYFSRISRRPKLIGNKESNFVASIRTSFKQTIQSRFSPLIYFWGTNPQTALFGYLQGQTSNDEMPRSKFHRQYLYVSDVQYLASNIDLSEHYEKCMRAGTKRSHFNHRLCQLEEHQQLQQSEPQLTSPKDAANHHLNDNLRLVMSGGGRHLEEKNKNYLSESEEEELNRSQNDSESDTTQQVAVATSAASKMISRMLIRTASADCSESSAIGSSSDSGVFANSSSNSSSFSSSSSDSSLTIDMNTSQSSRSSSSTMSSSSSKKSTRNKCACICTSLYESNLDEMVTIRTASEKRQQQQDEFKREHFEFGQCALDWYLDSHQQYHENKAVALISAGMTTGSDKKYVTDTVQTLHKLGYEVCVFIRRGVGGLKLNSTKFFSPSKWHDFETAILSIKKQRPQCRLVAIGFSFGSIELCRYLAMSGDRSLVASALLISCPFDPEAGGRNMRKRALNRKIDAYLAKNLGKQLFHALSFDKPATSVACSEQETSTTSLESMEEGDSGSQRSNKLSSGLEVAATNRRATNATVSGHAQQHVYANYNGSMVDLSSLPKIKSLVDFEDNYNRVIQNYPNSDAYGADSRLSDQLAHIRTPTLCLSSEDDFMAPVKLLPIKQIEANENLCMILTKRGGHMAFIDGLVWPRKPYFAQRIIKEYMRLNFSSKQQQRRQQLASK